MGIGPGGGPCGVVGSTRTDGAEKKNKFYFKNWFSMLFAETLASSDFVVEKYYAYNHL